MDADEAGGSGDAKATTQKKSADKKKSSKGALEADEVGVLFLC